MGKNPVGTGVIFNFLPLNVIYGNLVGSIRNHSSSTDPWNCLPGEEELRVRAAGKTAILLPFVERKRHQPSTVTSSQSTLQASSQIPKQPITAHLLALLPAYCRIQERKLLHLPLNHATYSFLRSAVGKHSSVHNFMKFHSYRRIMGPSIL
uniref:Uncharacterized protein n=1 Tax=Micrurus spixii TaxID=129469 RepID=A0A2D4NDZ7_9SAUR